MALLGLLLLAAAAMAVRWPLLVALPSALLTGWIGIAFLVRAHELRREPNTRRPALSCLRCGPPTHELPGVRESLSCSSSLGIADLYFGVEPRELRLPFPHGVIAPCGSLMRTLQVERVADRRLALHVAASSATWVKHATGFTAATCRKQDIVGLVN